MRERLVTALAIAAILGTLLGLILLTSHRCEKGHYDTARVGAWTEMSPTFDGDGNIVAITPVDHPAHDERYWVCECGQPGIAR